MKSQSENLLAPKQHFSQELGPSGFSLSMVWRIRLGIVVISKQRASVCLYIHTATPSTQSHRRKHTLSQKDKGHSESICSFNNQVCVSVLDDNLPSQETYADTHRNMCSLQEMTKQELNATKELGLC